MGKQAFVAVMMFALFSLGCDFGGDAIDSGFGAEQSRFGSRRSHHTGTDCLACHQSGGTALPVFTMAGSVYEPDLTTVNPAAVILVGTGSGFSWVAFADVEVDALGNFYTTQALPAPFYLKVRGDRVTSNMSFAVVDGACNSCHGVTANYIHTRD